MERPGWRPGRLAALVAVNNIASFLLYFVQEKFNMPGEQAAGLAGQLPMVLGGFVILFGLVAGWLSDRYDRRILTAISGVVGAIGVVVIVLGTGVPMMLVSASEASALIRAASSSALPRP